MEIEGQVNKIFDSDDDVNRNIQENQARLNDLDDAISEISDDTNSIPALLPFYSLRTFLDAEYSAILGYGFYEFSKKFNKLFVVIDKTATTIPHEFWLTVSTCVLFAVLFILMIDDYVRRRIITALAPCRSIRRFSLDVLIGLFFLMSFHFAANESLFVYFATAVAFFVANLWTNKVRREADAWKENPITQDSRMRCTVKNWPLYKNRLEYLSYSFFSWGCGFIFLFGVLALSDESTKKYLLSVFVFGFIVLCLESVRFFNERIIINRHKNMGDHQEFGILISVGWMPGWWKKQLKSWARKVSKSFHSGKN